MPTIINQAAEVLIPFRKSGQENDRKVLVVTVASVLIPFRKSGQENTRLRTVAEKVRES